jgi:parallel beta-helix repeat protein
MIYASRNDSYNIDNVNNETFIDNPNDADLVFTLSNGVPLNDYITPKSNDLYITTGNWTIKDLQVRFPEEIEKVGPTESGNEYLIKKSIIIGKDAEFNILGDTIRLYSLSIKDNNPVVIITYGKSTILNSTITSWDPNMGVPDANPYHPRSILVSRDGGTIDVINSIVSYLGFSQGGIFTLHSSLAALNYFNTTGFIINNSTISHNLYGVYTDNSSNFKITNNQIYDHIGYGLDPHSGSKNFVIDSNHVFVSGEQGIICSYQCSNVTITNNIVEYNEEGIGLHWLTNSSIVKDNIIKYNKNYGLFIKTNSSNNLLENNTLIGNGHGVALLEMSNNNTIRKNTILYNVLSKDPIFEDKDSHRNFKFYNKFTEN